MLRSFSGWPVAVAAMIVCLAVATARQAVADDAEKDAASETDGSREAASAQDTEEADRYKLPVGDSATLLKFIHGLQAFEPETAAQYFDHQKKAPAAMKQAAEKILEMEEDPAPPAAQQAQRLLLGAKIAGLGNAEPAQQNAIVAEIEAVLKAAPALSRHELGVAFMAASTLEREGNEPLAILAYKNFGQMFSTQKDPELAGYGAKMLGAARRLELPGQEFKLEGKLFDGSEFDWKSYRGKVVLVDFWATWCGPCLKELPNVRKNYDLYHDKGFDVVGISLDSEREALEAFLNKSQLPWPTLFQDGAGWNHPTAAYYGVMSIPMVILVDKDGKVISLDARGPELGRLLEEQLGAADAG